MSIFETLQKINEENIKYREDFLRKFRDEMDEPIKKKKTKKEYQPRISNSDLKELITKEEFLLVINHLEKQMKGVDIKNYPEAMKLLISNLLNCEFLKKFLVNLSKRDFKFTKDIERDEQYKTFDDISQTAKFPFLEISSAEFDKQFFEENKYTFYSYNKDNSKEKKEQKEKNINVLGSKLLHLYVNKLSILQRSKENTKKNTIEGYTNKDFRFVDDKNDEIAYKDFLKSKKSCFSLLQGANSIDSLFKTKKRKKKKKKKKKVNEVMEKIIGKKRKANEHGPFQLNPDTDTCQIKKEKDLSSSKNLSKTNKRRKTMTNVDQGLIGDIEEELIFIKMEKLELERTEKVISIIRNSEGGVFVYSSTKITLFQENTEKGNVKTQIFTKTQEFSFISNQYHPPVILPSPMKKFVLFIVDNRIRTFELPNQKKNRYGREIRDENDGNSSPGFEIDMKKEQDMISCGDFYPEKTKILILGNRKGEINFFYYRKKKPFFTKQSRKFSPIIGIKCCKGEQLEKKEKSTEKSDFDIITLCILSAEGVLDIYNVQIKMLNETANFGKVRFTQKLKVNMVEKINANLKFFFTNLNIFGISFQDKMFRIVIKKRQGKKKSFKKKNKIVDLVISKDKGFIFWINKKNQIKSMNINEFNTKETLKKIEPKTIFDFGKKVSTEEGAFVSILKNEEENHIYCVTNKGYIRKFSFAQIL